MKINKVVANNRKKEFSITNGSGNQFPFPYQKTEPQPTTENKVRLAYIDKELGSEAITYVLESGDEGTIHIEQVLEYNGEPEYFTNLLIYKLTLEAQRYAEASELSRRQLANRLNTSVPQLYRLLDPANTSKSLKQLISLLHILDCDVDVVINSKSAA